jgi:hypothetical protein
VSVEELVRCLCRLPSVRDAQVLWSPGHARIRVVLSKWTFVSMRPASDCIDSFARDHVHEFTVTAEFVPSEMPG